MSVITMKQLLEAGVHLANKLDDGILKWLNTSLLKEMASIS